MADPASIAAGGNTVSHAGLFTAFGGWLLSSEAAVLIGIVMSIGGFLVNVYFKWRQQQRQIAAAAEQSRQDAEYHAARKIGRASCRERVCQYVEISVVAVSLKKKKDLKQIYSVDRNKERTEPHKKV